MDLLVGEDLLVVGETFLVVGEGKLLRSKSICYDDDEVVGSESENC